MVKSYYKWELDKTIGVVASPQASIHYDKEGKNVITGSLSDLNIWNLKKSNLEKIIQKNGKKSNITSIAYNQNSNKIAVGYQNGGVSIYKLEDGSEEMNTIGHSTSVQILSFNEDGSLLASGGDDTDIILWDVLNSSGMYRLRGHKGSITGIAFLNKINAIVTCSKDMLIKIWELDTQHCIQTLIGTRHEIWSLSVDNEEKRLIVGSVDNLIRIWDLEPLYIEGKELYMRDPIFLGSVKRKYENRVLNIKFDPSGNLFALHGDSNIIEIFKKRTEKEKTKKIKSKEKKKKEKEEKKLGKAEQEDDDDEEEEEEDQAIIEYTPHCEIRSKQKIRSFDFHPLITFNSNDKKFKIVISTLRNTIEEYLYESKKQHEESMIERYGHGTPIKSISISSDDVSVASVSNGQCKIWSVEFGNCLRSFNVGNATTCIFLPGDNHIAIGTKNGEIEIYEISSMNLIETIKAHESSISSIILSPDKKGIISGGDKTVKFWNFELILDEEYSKTTKRLSIYNEHTLKMNENVLTIQCSSDAKYIAISLLDSTVKVFFLDSLKFYLSLFGHKLPVNSIDISSDGSLIITASSDKNIKIWGLDFGDCHKSIFAHQESISKVSFLKNTHYFCSVSKDGGVKIWDGDNFKCFQEIRDKSLHSPLYDCVLSYDGYKLISTGHERALFIYNQTDDLFFLEEEEERKLEAEYEKQLVESQQFLNLQDPNAESTFAGKRTIETITDGDKLIEAIEYAMRDDESFEEYEKNPNLLEKPIHNPILLNLDTDEYIWKSLTKIKRSEIENVLSIIPFKHGVYVLKKMENIFKKVKVNVEISTRIIISICEIFQFQILSEPSLIPLIISLSKSIKDLVSNERNQIGFNIAGLQFIKQRLSNEKEMLNIEEAIILKRHFEKKKTK
eukprot:gene3947-7157_t